MGFPFESFLNRNQPLTATCKPPRFKSVGSPSASEIVRQIQEEAMTGFPRLLIASSVVAFTFAATAFRVPKLSTASGGSVAPAGRMLVPRSGTRPRCGPTGRVLMAGGMRRNQDFYKSAELYDPATGKFEATAKGTRNQAQRWPRPTIIKIPYRPTWPASFSNRRLRVGNLG
jgi:hypothetical protein